jgi:DNA repair exonuclease SbcCD nuclease subunit
VIKLLHTADWQIGKAFGSFAAEEAVPLSEARFVAVERLARYATEHGADLVGVAGDVFDAQGLANKTLHRLFNAMGGYAGPWVVIPGNHDPALADSVWTRAHRAGAVPPNVHLCLEPTPLYLEALRVVVLPAPLQQRHTYHDLTEWFDGCETPEGWIRIGLAHGAVQGLLIDSIDSTNPIAADRARSARLDYLALGDWHGTRVVDERTAYAGTPETDRFKSNDSGQALWVEISAGRPPEIRPVAIGQYRWQQWETALQVPTDLDALVARLAELDATAVIQLTVTGQTDLGGQRQLVAAIEAAQGRARCLLANLSALRVRPTDDDIATLRADGYLGDALAELRAAQDGPQAELARDALLELAHLLEARGTRVSA